MPQTERYSPADTYGSDNRNLSPRTHCIHSVRYRTCICRSPVEEFPWDRKLAEYVELYDEDFRALREALPEGMKAVGGIGNGLFETLQDFVPFQELPFLQMDEPEAYDAAVLIRAAVPGAP